MKPLAFIICIVVVVFGCIYTDAADTAQDLNAFACGVIVVFSASIAAAVLAGMMIETFIQRRRRNARHHIPFKQCK